MKNKGFTLAEVLITLGIIGIVAALTIPTLIQNINGARYKSKFKKSVSTLSQAARTSLAKYDLDFGGINIGCGYAYSGDVSEFSASGGADKPEETRSICAIFHSTLAGASYTDVLNYNIKGLYGVADEEQSWSNGIYILSDGITVMFNIASYNKGGNTPCSLKPDENLQDRLNGVVGAMHENYGFSDPGDWFRTVCLGYIDLDGPNGPNKVVQCSHEDTNYNVNTPCVVENKDITDVYPVVFHDATVEPATNAAVYVLKNAK